MCPSGPTSGALQVEPEKLRILASAFAAGASRLGSAVPRFEASASNVEEAFGLLGPSDDLYFEYLGLVRDTVRGLVDLRHRLEQTSEGLTAAAGTYEGAELGSAIPGPAGAW